GAHSAAVRHDSTADQNLAASHRIAFTRPGHRGAERREGPRGIGCGSHGNEADCGCYSLRARLRTEKYEYFLKSGISRNGLEVSRASECGRLVVVVCRGAERARIDLDHP